MDSARTKPLVVGLTGGVASGKSAAAACFEALGVPVIDTDRLAREAVQPGSGTLADIVEAFGEDVLTAAGELDRERMRERVFSDEAARRRLEAILHPCIGELLDAELSEIRAPYCIVAIPLLVEAGWTERVDRVLVVDVPEAVQVERLQARDGMDAGAARRMIRTQADRDDRLRVADDVLDNSGTREELEARVARLHTAFLAAAGARSA